MWCLRARRTDATVFLTLDDCEAAARQRLPRALYGFAANGSERGARFLGPNFFRSDGWCGHATYRHATCQRRRWSPVGGLCPAAPWSRIRYSRRSRSLPTAIWSPGQRNGPSNCPSARRFSAGCHCGLKRTAQSQCSGTSTPAAAAVHGLLDTLRAIARTPRERRRGRT